MATDTSNPSRIAGVEVRSIDYVPLNERHGKVWSQGPLWFMSNAQIATLAVGTFSAVGGGNLIWSLLAIVLGATSLSWRARTDGAGVRLAARLAGRTGHRIAEGDVGDRRCGHGGAGGGRPAPIPGA